MARYYCIRQQDVTDCGAACLATVCRQYGLKMPIGRIREAARTDRQGTSAAGLLAAAKELGLFAKAVRGDAGALRSRFPLPAIAHVKTPEGVWHYVVLHQVGRRHVLVADPAKGLLRQPLEDFLAGWSGALILLTPSPQFERGNREKGVFRQFLRLLAPQRKLLGLILLASLLITLLGIGASFYYKFLMDAIIPFGAARTLHAVSIGILALYLLRVALEGCRGHLMLYLSQRLDIPLILGSYQHVLGLPMGFFGSRRTGEIISRLQDTSKIREAVSGAAITLLLDTLMAAGGAVLLYWQSPRLFLISVLIVTLYAALVLALGPAMRRANEQAMEDNAQLTSYLVESLDGIETVKAFGAEEKVAGKTEQKFVRMLRSIFRAGRCENLQETLSGGVSLVGGMVILWAGSLLVLQGEMTFGALLTFDALLLFFLEPIKNLIDLQPEMQAAVVAAKRLGQLLEATPELTGADRRKCVPESLCTDISVRSLTFGYGLREPVLHEVDLDIRAGERVALVGESGSGKTTLCKLLLGLYPITQGEIRFGQYDIRDLSLAALRERTAYVPQDIFLYSGTILENLRLGAPQASLEEVIAACRRCQADEFIERLPDRYDTLLEEGASNLSGGQKQRLAIARALLREPDLLILDEATSHLDSIAEQAIAGMLASLPKRVTTVVIAHRLSTIMHCERIYVLDRGRVVQCGTHDELMTAKGKYCALWKNQMLQPAGAGEE
ncbi:peptidase domain-containing ABC transporter [Harryflintia acetispora]|uniref:peptidase domain-containing ABC transporter n=1 Tax=Harryflintia acetispora TaxID=1849041 RepID=UPI001899E750|nr:peptidase domain-containing ABC transporter [Harryflintia acetispora]